MDAPHVSTATLSTGTEDAILLPSVIVSVTPADGSTVDATLGLAPLVVGTSPECEVVLSDPRVSRQHCELRITRRGITDLQPELLRALEARQVRRLGSNEWVSFDARVVAATHRNLRSLVATGAFREDLYFRLAVVEFDVPSLRERKDDIPLLVERFLSRMDPPHTVADLPPFTMSLLEAHDWPGNVRELRNMVARLILFRDLGREALEDFTQRTRRTAKIAKKSRARRGALRFLAVFARNLLIAQRRKRDAALI